MIERDIEGKDVLRKQKTIASQVLIINSNKEISINSQTTFLRQQNFAIVNNTFYPTYAKHKKQEELENYFFFAN